MVQTLGMSDKLGYISFESGDLVKSYSDHVQKIIDDEVESIIR